MRRPVDPELSGKGIRDACVCMCVCCASMLASGEGKLSLDRCSSFVETTTEKSQSLLLQSTLLHSMLSDALEERRLPKPENHQTENP